MHYLLLCALLACHAVTQAGAPAWKTAPEESSTIKWQTPSQGYCPALFALLEREGHRVEILPEFVPQIRIEHWVGTGELNLACGLARTSKRETQFVFINVPAFYQDYVLIARKNDPVSPRNWDEVRVLDAEGLLLFNRDSPSADYLSKLGGLHFDATASTIEANLRKLQAKRGRYVYHPRLAAQQAITKMRLENETRIILPPIHRMPFYLVVNSKVPQARIDALTKTLQHLSATGELQQLESAWFPSKAE